MRECYECGAEIDEGDDYCERCFAALYPGEDAVDDDGDDDGESAAIERSF